MVMSGMEHIIRDDHMLSPAEPTQTRFYVQDKLEFKDVVVQVGLSLESIDHWRYGPRFRR